MVKKFSILFVAILLFSGCTNQETKEEPLKAETDSSLPDESKIEGTTEEKNETEEDSSKAIPADSSPKTTPPKDDNGGQFKEPDDTAEANEMIPSITYKQENKTMIFTFTVKNKSDHMFTYNFETAQQYDYEIKDSNGNIIRKYKKEKSSIPSKNPVKPGGTLTYEVPIENLAPGSYEINFVLTAKEMQPSADIKFEVKVQ